MRDPANPMASSWNTSPSAKARNAAARSVTALLDELAPERVLRRVEELKGPVEQHRSPTGCVLQAATAAVSVSWFAETDKNASLGELHIVVWQGTVARRGATRNKKGAKVVADLVLKPIEPPQEEFVWEETKDSVRHSTVSLAAKVLDLLAKQVGAD